MAKIEDEFSHIPCKHKRKWLRDKKRGKHHKGTCTQCGGPRYSFSIPAHKTEGICRACFILRGDLKKVGQQSEPGTPEYESAVEAAFMKKITSKPNSAPA